MANGVTIPIKGDISNLNSEIEKAKKLIGSTQSELYANEKKLYDVKEKRVKQDERYNNVMSNYKRLLKEEIIDKDTYTKKIKQLNEIKKENNREIIAEERAIRNVIAANKQRISLNQRFVELEQKNNVAQNISTQTIDKKEKSLSNLANTTIRYLRWAGTIAGVVYAGQRAWQATLGVGLEVSKIVETNTYGIAALVSANTEMVDSLGNAVTPLQKFTMGQEVAKKALAELRAESVKTAATFPQLINIYQQALPHALSVSNNAFGNTVEEISKNTIRFASRLSVLGESIGMEQQKILEESRSMFSANASTDSLMSTLLFGSPTAANEAIKKAKETTGGLKKLFDMKLEPFDVLLNTKTYSRSILEIQASWSNLMGDMMQKSGAFKDITDTFYSMSKSITEGSDDIIKKFDAVYNASKAIVSVLDDIAIAGALFYVGGKLDTGLGKIATSFATSEMKALSFKGIIEKIVTSIKLLPSALMAVAAANPFTALAVAGTAAFEVFTMVNDQLIKMQHGGKTQEEWNAQIKKTNDEYVSVEATLLRVNKALEEKSKREKGIAYRIDLDDKEGRDSTGLKKQLEDVRKEIESLNAAKESLNTFEDAKKNLAVVTEIAELRKKQGFNDKLREEAQKEIEDGLGNIHKLEKKRNEFQEEYLRIQKQATEAQNLHNKSTDKSEVSLANINDLKAREKELLDAVSSVDKKIVEEKEKSSNKQIADNNKIAKQQFTLNQQYADQAAVQAEIAMIESGIFDDEKLKVQLSLLKITSLTEEYSKLTSIEEKEKARLELLREGLRYEELISAEKSKRLQNELEYFSRTLELQSKGFSRDMESAGVEYAKKVTSIDNGSGSIQEKERLIALETELYNKTVERINLERNVEFTDTLKSFQEDALERQIALNESMFEFGDSFDGIAKQISTASKAFMNMNTIAINGKKQEAQLDKKYSKAFLDYADDEIKTKKLLAEYSKDQKTLVTQQQQAEIAGYSNMAGAMSSMFEEGSKGAEAFRLVQMGLATVNAINAVLSQGQGNPYTAIPRMVAMAAMVAGLVSQLGVTIGSFGGNKETTSYDKYAAMKANEGKGSTFGDADKASESITKSLDILKDFAEPQYKILGSMNRYLATIASNIGGVTNLLIREGGFAFGEGFTAKDTGWKNNIGVSSGVQAGVGMAGNAVYGAGVGILTGSGALAGALAGTGVGALAMIADKILLGGAVSKMINSAVNALAGGLFGKKSVSQTLSDSGMQFADQLLEKAKEDFEGSVYQTIATTVKKKSWFSSSSSTSYNTLFDRLDSEIENQFTLIFSVMYDTVLEASKALDYNTSEIATTLDKFMISIGKISLKDKTGEEIQESLTNVFGKVSDDLAKFAIRGLEDFQKVGEGMFETLTRVATGMEEAEYYIERLGGTFKDLSYLEVINKQGNIGFEALLQSIVKTDEATYGLSNNLVQIIGSLDSTAEELYQAYTGLDSLRDSLKFLNLEVEALSFASIRGAGSAEALASGMLAYMENFLTDSEQLSFSIVQMQKEFNKLNIAMPVGKDGFKNLINSLDLTTESGQELYGRLIILSEGFAEVADSVKESIETLEESLKEESQGFFNTFISSISKMFDSVVSMAKSTRDTGNKEETIYNQFVEYNKLLAKFEAAQLSGDIITAESAYSSLLGMSSSLAGAGYQTEIVNLLEDKLTGFESTKDILRVNIVDGLSSLLNLTEEQTNQLKMATQDGVITNDELSGISNLSEEQTKSIKEFASNSNYFSTEDTLQTLSELAREQLDSLRQSQAEETEKISSKTFTAGDYIGTQEKIDIANLLGVSYDSAKPLVEKLQGLSGANQDVAQSEIQKILGFTEGGTSYDMQMDTQLQKISPYLSNPNIQEAVSNVKSSVQTNIETIAREKFEAERQAFLSNYNSLVAQLPKEKAQYDEVAWAMSTFYKAHKDWWTSNNENAANSILNKYGLGFNTNEKRGENWNQVGYNSGIALRNKQYEEYQTVLSSVIQMQKQKELKGYASGGYTGNIPTNAIAGFVHGREHVIDATATSQINSVGSVTDMVSKYTNSNAFSKELVNIKNVLLEQTKYFNGIIYELKNQIQILTESRDVQNSSVVILEKLERLA